MLTLDSHETCFFFSSLKLLLEMNRIWTPGAIFWGPFDPDQGQKMQKISFSYILQRVSTGFTLNLEILLEVCTIWTRGHILITFLPRTGPK